jgi:hypothetical protein
MPNNARRSLELKRQGSVQYAKDRGAESAVLRCFVPGPEEPGRWLPRPGNQFGEASYGSCCRRRDLRRVSGRPHPRSVPPALNSYQASILKNRLVAPQGYLFSAGCRPTSAGLLCPLYLLGVGADEGPVVGHVSAAGPPGGTRNNHWTSALF